MTPGPEIENVTNHPMHGSGEVNGIEIENLSSPPRDR